LDYGDATALEGALQGKRHAALVLEPVQAEAGIRVPSKQYLQKAQELCLKTGTLFVIDEVQTGMFRTGTFLASTSSNSDRHCDSCESAQRRADARQRRADDRQNLPRRLFLAAAGHRAHLHLQRNSLSMRAGLASLDVLESQQLGRGQWSSAKHPRQIAQTNWRHFEMVKEVRGMGLLSGIEFVGPKKLSLRMPFEAFHRIHPAMFGQILVMRMFREKNILTQICGNNFMVLKAAPPLVVKEEQFG